MTYMKEAINFSLIIFVEFIVVHILFVLSLKNIDCGNMQTKNRFLSLQFVINSGFK